jgi:tRNA (guanosine-2'-O-)-methyltransferase
MPVFSYTDFQDFNAHRPFDCKLVGIELTDEAIEVSEYKHPKRAVYLLGAEDNGLSRECIDNLQDIIKLHGTRSMNVSVAGSIVLYDRYRKQE